MPKSTLIQSALRKSINQSLNKIKSQKSFFKDAKKILGIFNLEKFNAQYFSIINSNELGSNQEKKLVDIFKENTQDNFQLEEIAKWLIKKMGGVFQFQNHYTIDDESIFVKMLTRDFMTVLKKSHETSQQYENLYKRLENQNKPITHQDYYHLILIGLSLYIFENKALFIKQEQDRFDNARVVTNATSSDHVARNSITYKTDVTKLSTINEEPETEKSNSLEFSDSEWEEIELGYANHLKSSLCENEESETKQAIDSADLEWDHMELLYANNINSHPNSEFDQKATLTWIKQPDFKTNNCVLILPKSSNSENEELETKQSVESSEFVEDSMDLEWHPIKLDLATPLEAPTSQNKISGDLNQKNKYTFFPPAHVHKDEGGHGESLQKVMQATIKTMA